MLAVEVKGNQPGYSGLAELQDIRLKFIIAF
jgi:hypothetical protein